ncbi:MAG: DUF262 domain-containing protein [Patescibacteria group bacterium]
MTQYWLDLFTPETWEEAKKNNFKLSGFRENRWHLTQQIKPGDFLVCYITGEMRFSGILKVISKPYFSHEASKKVWRGGPFPCLMDIEPVITLDLLHSVPADRIVSELTIAKKWGGIRRGSPNRLNEEDGNTIKNLLEGSQKDKKEYPLSEKRLMKIKKSYIITDKMIQKKKDTKIKTRKNDKQTEDNLENSDVKSGNNMKYNTISYNRQKIDKLDFRAVDIELRAILYDGEEKYKIPRYQRPYSWTNDQVSDLWGDLISGESTFLGSFVFNYERYDEDGFVEVIDGQQRLITLTILMAVIRDKYKELDQTEKSILTQSIIARKDPVTAKQENRLKCGDSLNNFFTEHIQKQDSNILASKPKTKEEKLIKSNYEFIRDKISEDLNQFNLEDKVKCLDDFKARIFSLKIILIKIENEEDAYSIFETVNARGADLTAADLLKNYLFGKLPKTPGGEDVAKDIWSNIENNVESARGPLNVSKFIRYFWLSRYSFVPEKKLYKEIKNEVKGDPRAFLQELQKASGFYYKIANDSISPEDWLEDFQEKKTAQKINEAMAGLRIMGITQCYSLVLCLLMNKDKIEYDFSEIFKVIERYHFAYSAVCKLSGNVVERVYFNAAKEVRKAIENSSSKENIIKNVQRALSQFEKNLSYPNKSLFKEKFLEIEYRNYQLVLYILSNIEKALSATEEKTLNFTKVNIEHVLPQDPSQWSLTKKEIKNYVNMLGNLTLIAKKINGLVGNKKLQEKVGEFRRSDLEINKKLIKEFEKLNYKWGEKEIRERQEELADLAYDVVWKFHKN